MEFPWLFLSQVFLEKGIFYVFTAFKIFFFIHTKDFAIIETPLMENQILSPSF